MRSLPPYSIKNIDLAQEIPFSFDQNKHYYFVFWYKSIPLGQFYHSAATLLTENFFWNVCLKSIKPSLLHYAAKLNEPITILQTDHADAPLIQHVCRAVIEPFVPKALSGQCPITVVICTRDRADHLKNCLTAIQQLAFVPEEIIVVDNASRDDSTRSVAAQFKNVRYIREDKPGLDIARNTGARHASRSIIAYTDDDTLPHRYWLYHVSKTFDDASIDAMTGLVLAASLQTEAQLIFEKYWPFNRGYVDKIFDDTFFSATVSSGSPVWEIGAGANMAFRRSMLEAIGYFDERLDVGAAGCSGDSELWYRALANGHTIAYNPRAVVHHLHRDSLQELKKQLYYYMRGFAAALLIQHQRFGHRGNIKHLFYTVPLYYAKLIYKGFPKYRFQHQTLFSEIKGILSGIFFYLRHRNTDPKIFSRHEKN
jgi:glycosyltransferase involved in cell wall biosynthesis